MHVLFCGGSRKAPSWKMRGEQVAASLPNALAINDPDLSDIAAADVVVIVKRYNNNLLRKIKQSKKKLIWDPLDFWPQGDNGISPTDLPSAIMLAKRHVSRINPDGIICANERMAKDFKIFYTKPITHIYHHARLDAAPIEFAEIGWYDGCEKHVEEWLESADKELRKHGWEFKIGKPDKGHILFGFRDKNTWLASRWKSNVKASNAIAYRMRFLAEMEYGYTETIGKNEYLPIWIDKERLAGAIELALQPIAMKELQYQYSCFNSENYTLAHISARYKAFLQ